MIPFLARRVGLSLIALWVLATAVFLISRCVPGDPAMFAAGLEASRDEIERVRQEYGLDRDLLTQYVRYVAGVARGDLGRSMYTGRPVVSEMLARLPATIELTLMGVILGLLAGVPLAILSAKRRGTIVDHLSRTVSVAGLAMPVFWYGVMLQVLFYGHLRWLPVGGRMPITARITTGTGFLVLDSLLARDWGLLLQAVKHLALPSFAISLLILALTVRMLRSSLLDALSQDYIRTASAKGLSERVVWRRHALRNAVIPLMTVLGVQIAHTFGGAVLTETVFNWPGIGRYLFTAAVNLDYPVISGMALLVGVAFILSSLCVDLLQGAMDPRIVYE